MLQHPSQRVHEAWTEIVRNYEDTGELVTFRMTLGDQDVSKYLETGSLSADTGALPWALETNLSMRVPVSLLNAPVKLYVEMAGSRMLLFNGRASYPEPSFEWATSLSSFTPGHWMDLTTLEKYTTFSGWKPEDVIRNALTRVPYDRSRVRIHPFAKPLIYRIREDSDFETARGSWASGFEDEDTPMSILSSVLGEVRGVSIDTPMGGNMTIKDPGIGEGSQVVWDYDTASHEVLEPFVSPSWAEPDSQYRKVTVRDYLENGKYRIPPRHWYVDYTGYRYPPVTNRTLYIAPSDESPTALAEAQKQAIEAARTLGKGLWSGEIVVDFNFFLQPYDVITIAHNWEDTTGRYRRLWRCIIQSVSHEFGTEALATTLGFSAALIQDRRISDPPRVFDGVTPGNTVVAGQGFAYGSDLLGDWMDPVFMPGVPWGGIEIIDGEEYGWFDPALAPPGIFGVDENGDFLEVSGAVISPLGRDELGDWVDATFIEEIPPWAGVEVIDGQEYGWFDPELAPFGTVGTDELGDWVEVPGEPPEDPDDPEEPPEEPPEESGDYLTLDEDETWVSVSGDYVTLEESAPEVTVDGDYVDVGEAASLFLSDTTITLDMTDITLAD